MRGKIRHSCKQKDWFRNMDNIVVNYRHRGEANDMYLVHMSCPKCQIDRIGFYPKNWRWK